jgi:hypothetical protein
MCRSERSGLAIEALKRRRAMARTKTAMLLALLIFGVMSSALPLAERGKANAAGDSEVSRPSTAKEYFEMVQGLADQLNRGHGYFAKIITDSSGTVIVDPDHMGSGEPVQGLPARFRAPTAVEIERLVSLWPKVSPEKNAAYYFAKAILEQPDPDQAPAGSSAIYWLRPYGGDFESLEKWVERNRPVLGAMREGMNQDVYCLPVVIVEETGMPEPPLSFLVGARYLAHCITDAGFVEEVKGNPDLAASYYLECIRFGKKFQGATLLESLVGVAAQAIGEGALDRLVANATLSDKTLRGVIVACREAEAAQDVPARTWANESALMDAKAALAKAPYRDHPVALLTTKYAKALRDFTIRKSLDELLLKKVLVAAQAGELKEFSGKEPARQVFDEWGRLNVRLRVTQIRAGIVLYQKANGRLPDNLDTLCPDLLPSVPIDPFSGKPMRYAKTPDGWKLWSVGEDNLDHGGEASIVDERGWVGPDFVFTDKVRSSIERRSHGAIRSLPTRAEKPKATE